MMDAADGPRRGDYDGRGNLSLVALEEFCVWFLEVMLDQIRFSARIFDVAGLEARYRRLVGDVVPDRRAPDLIAAVLRFGSLQRGDAATVLKVSERTARATLRTLVEEGFCVSETPKTPVRVAFPWTWRERLLLHEIIAREQPYTFLYVGKWTAVLDKRIVIKDLDKDGVMVYRKIKPTKTGNYTFDFNRWIKVPEMPNLTPENW